MPSCPRGSIVPAKAGAPRREGARLARPSRGARPGYGWHTPGPSDLATLIRWRSGSGPAAPPPGAGVRAVRAGTGARSDPHHDRGAAPRRPLTGPPAEVPWHIVTPPAFVSQGAQSPTWGLPRQHAAGGWPPRRAADLRRNPALRGFSLVRDPQSRTSRTRGGCELLCVSRPRQDVTPTSP
jgi:hypothetical protein